MGRNRVEAPELRVEVPEQRVRVEAPEQRVRVEDDLGRHLVELGEGPAVGLLGLIASAWSQVPMDVAAAVASRPVTGAWTSGSR